MSALDAFGPRSWARTEATGFGRLPMSTFLARKQVVSLDGEWSFLLRDRPEDVMPEDLSGPVDGWASIEVPGCWTMQGFDRPQYTNIQMPFPGPPPRVPEVNPTGVHRRSVTLPAAWAGQRLVLHVGAAETVLYVHVDGEPVAMGKDSRLPTEVELTGIVTPGVPFELALTVVRWSDATYLEDQDHWHHAGVHRSVFAYATPTVHIADVHTVADRDPVTGDGRLRTVVHLGADGHGPSGWTARVRLGDVVGEAPARFEHPTDSLTNWLVFDGRHAVVELEVPAVAPWSAEVPTLHRVTVTLLDDRGTEIDEVELDVGFRRVEVVGHELRVNGRAVLIKGVNRHDHDPRRGKAVTAAGIEADLLLMKQHGINAVRTSHYPNDPVLYDLCDRLGLYVVDEANSETHAYLRSLLKDPRWGPAVLERIVRMAQRDKNHPSIIIWSLGNESGNAPILHAAAEWLRQWDGTRPVQYESSIGEAIFADLTAGGTLELGPHGPPDAGVGSRGADVPGGRRSGVVGHPGDARPSAHHVRVHPRHEQLVRRLDAYWHAIRTHPGLQGGFVWDWVDQALVQQQPDGTERLAYGGDFGEEPHDGPFCLNGLVDAHRNPHPALLELAAVIAPVRIAAVDAARGVVRITNEHAFVDLAHLQPSWAVEVDGRAIDGGLLDRLDLGPGASAEVRVPVPPVELRAGERAHLTVAFTLVDDQPWAEAGHVVAREQLAMASGPGPSNAPSSSPSAGPVELAALEPELALWRAPIDNETFAPVLDPHAARWERLGLRDAASIAELVTSTSDDGVGGGVVVVHEVVVPPAVDDLARVGVRLRLGPGIRTVEWLGDGPHEGYSDRGASTRAGRWTTPVDEWAVPYVHPQASGNRTGVRWLRFLDAGGEPVLTIDQMDAGTPDGGLEVTVSRWTQQEVADAAHLEDLPPVAERDECYVWLDARHRGVGSGAVGPDTAPEHRIGPGPYRWSYRLR
ncbi:glycoside hydrolase family 2 TIM barrel-domain containing protein [Aquihabitans daechungensis]|uniref:glycoside hydrolase family 2 TIM barrel-domain containing protein n=1 Tax=Aquihabitans daechungensis TaxID=1052257 RepID=UPI003BA02B2A